MSRAGSKVSGLKMRSGATPERVRAVETRARRQWEMDRLVLVRAGGNPPDWPSAPGWSRRAYLRAADFDLARPAQIGAADSAEPMGREQ